MSSWKQEPFYITWCPIKGDFRQKKLSVQVFNSVAHIITVMYNSLGTHLHLCIFNSHMPNPYPHPTNNVGRVSACIQNFSEFQHCIGWGEEELQKNFGKDAQRVFYKGFQKLQNVMNTASLH